MAVDKVTILGLKEAQATFRQLPAIAREAFNEAISNTAEHIVDRARGSLVPGSGYRTGQLKQALGWNINKRSGSAKVGVRKGFERFQPGRTDRLHRPTKVGHLVEFGHSGGASPHPFLVPAAEASKSFFLAQCRAAGPTLERDMARIGNVGSRNL